MHSFATTDEFDSYYLNQNVATYEPSATFSASVGAPAATPTSSANATIWSPILTDLPPVGANASLAQSFTAINGFAFAAMPTLEICQDDLVVFHLYSYGSFNDGFHVAHWHGNNIITPEGYNSATLSLLPGTMKTVTMYAQNVGVWQLLCHVAAHWQVRSFSLFYYCVFPDEKGMKLLMKCGMEIVGGNASELSYRGDRNGNVLKYNRGSRTRE